MRLDELKEHFFDLYGKRNRIFLSGLGIRIGFLSLAISDLQDAIRKEYSLKVIGVALARIVSRIFCIAENFRSLPLTEVMSQKYHLESCSYCQSSPCVCKERRPDTVLKPVSKIQLKWSLKQWQDHLGSLYGERNERSGIQNIINRLFKEVGELLSLGMDIPNMNLGLDEIGKEFALELSDALAWTIAVSNFYKIDLEETILNRYYYKHCWKCHKKPCICTHFNVKPVKWDVVYPRSCYD